MFFEDVILGETIEVGSHTFTEEEIITFAKKYDPQPFHIDPEAAKSHEFGGVVASGFHTGATWMRLMIAWRGKMLEEAKARGEEPNVRTGGASPGFLKMRWHGPVRPGDTISFSNTTWRRVELGSRSDLGIIQSRSKGVNQKGELVFSFIGQGLYPRRPK